MLKVTPIRITDAYHTNGYRMRVRFSDGTDKEIDFSDFINSTKIGALQKYKDIERFSTSHKIEDGMLVWGESWEMIFPNESLYLGKVGK